MPTFLVFKDGQKVDDLLGANPPALLNLLKKYTPEEAEASDKAEARPDDGTAETTSAKSD
jgi:thioredoxin 1